MNLPINRSNRWHQKMISITIVLLTSACNPSTTITSSSPSSESKMNHTGHQKMDYSTHRMDLGPADRDFDLRFIDAMIPHHQGAVIMAKEVLNKSKRPELKKLAQAMIDAQAQEIAQMKDWRKTWYPKAPATPMMWHTSMNHMMPMDGVMIKSMRMDMDLGNADAEFDKRFLDAMIPHHEAAVVMAKDLQSKTQRSELKKLAQDILTSQQTEIDQMKNWRKTW